MRGLSINMSVVVRLWGHHTCTPETTPPLTSEFHTRHNTRKVQRRQQRHVGEGRYIACREWVCGWYVLR